MYSLRTPSRGYPPRNRLTCSKDPDKPISAGFYRLEAGKELVYPYTYDEMKIVLEGFRHVNATYCTGEYQITDETGYSVTAKPGDVFYFQKGIIK
jgi:uncharacterized cupin superfamily protein